MPRDYWTPRRVQLRRGEAAAVLVRIQKGLDHICPDVVAVELVERVEPELPAAEVRVPRVVRVASEIPVVLHQHEGPVEFLLPQVLVVGYLPQRSRAPRRSVVRRQFLDELRALGLREHAARVLIETGDELGGRQRERERARVALTLDELQRVRLLIRLKTCLPIALPDDDSPPDALRVGQELFEV